MDALLLSERCVWSGCAALGFAVLFNVPPRTLLAIFLLGAGGAAVKLGLLATAAGRVVTQRQLLIGAWGPNHVEHAHYLRVYMAGLRRKLEPDPRLPVHILTEPGVGYRLALEPLSAARTPASAPPAG